MICSLLFYALYPLSRYLTAGRRSEASQKGVSSALVHGTAAWDGSAVSTTRFTQSQTTLPDQWLCSSSAEKGKTEEGMKEGSPEKEGDTGMEQKEEQRAVAVPHEEAKNGATKTSGEPQSEARKLIGEPQSEAMKTMEEPQCVAVKTMEEPQSEAMKTGGEPQCVAMKTSGEPQCVAMKTFEEPQCVAMKTGGEPQCVAMKTSGEPQCVAMKTFEEPQCVAMKTFEEPQSEAMKTFEEPQCVAMKTFEEPQSEAMKTSGEPQCVAMKTFEEPQSEAMKTFEEPQSEAMKTMEEPQSEAMKTMEEPQCVAMKTIEEPQNEVMSPIEKPQNEARKLIEEPQCVAMKTSGEPQCVAMKTFEEPHCVAMKTFEEPQCVAMKTFEEPQSEAMKTFEEPQCVAMKTFEEPQSEAMKTFEEPQSEAIMTIEEPQSEARKTSEEPQSEAMKTIEEPQSEAMKTIEEPQSEAMKTIKEPQSEAMKLIEEPQNEAMKLIEEPQNEAMKLIEEPQSEAMKLIEEPQSEAMKLIEEPQNEAMKLIEEPQSEAMKLIEEPQSEAMKLIEEPQSEAMKQFEEPQNEAMKLIEEPQSEAMKLIEETQNEAMKLIEEPQSEDRKLIEEPQSEDRKLIEEPQSEAMKTSKMPQGNMEVTMLQDICKYKRQNTNEATDVPWEHINPEQALAAQLKWLQTDASMKEMVCPGLEEIQIRTPLHNVEELVVSAEERVGESTRSGQQQTQIPSVESEPPAVSEVTECWDEYCISPAADEEYDGANGSKLAFGWDHANAQTHLTTSKPSNTQNSFHFPAGLGLAGEIECPLWQFPAGSYYPPLESAESFEVMWRVWQSAPAAEPALIPFPYTKSSMSFTVMSYNILAQDLLEANQELYMHCPLEVLDWSYRCSLLLEEIFKWAPDILCLQEVQEDHYHEQLYPVLCEMGYTCVYKCRTGPKTDGCATCYRSSSFSEVSVSLLEFFRPDVELLNRHNVGIVLLLRPAVAQGSEAEAAAGPLLCVGNTHLLFNPRRGDVKLAQLAMMLAEIDGTVQACKARGEQCNIVLCGDFNSLPHMPLYQLITTGKLFYRGLPAWMVSGQEDLSFKTYLHRLFVPLWPSALGITDNCQYSASKNTRENKGQGSGQLQYSHDFMRQLRYCPAARVRPVDLTLIQGVTDNAPDPAQEKQPYETSFGHTLTHSLDLQSVYQHVLPGSGAPEVTTVHSEAAATVDYIFYSPRRSSTSDQTARRSFVSEGLELIGSLCLLSEDVLWSMKGLPNHMFPSDHLSLVAKFQLDLNMAATGKTVGD